MMKTRFVGIALPVLLLLAACGGNAAQPTSPSVQGQAEGGKATPQRGPTVSPRVASPSPGKSANPSGGTGTGTSGTHNTGKQSGGGGGSKAAPSAQSVQPRSPGTYHYDTSGKTTYQGGFSEDIPSDTTLTADPPKGVKQRSVRDLRDSSGNGTVTETWLEFRDDGVYLDRVRSTTRNGPISDVRDFAPNQPVRVSQTGGGVGDHVEFTMSGSNTEVHVTIDVIRKEQLTIGGKSVDTYLVRTVSTFSGEVQGKSSSDTWFTPDHLLPVKEHVVTDAQVGANSVHTDYRAELKNLSPS